MVKSELARLVADRAVLSIKVAESVVDAVFEAITSALASGDRVELRGFGSFHVKQYEGYQGHNPRTGESIFVQPKRLPVFKPGKHLKERVDS